MRIPLLVRSGRCWLAQAMLTVALALAQATPAWADFEPGPPTTDPNFEIDTPSANALDQAFAGDDWETIYRCRTDSAGYNAGICATLGGLNANLINTTGILEDPFPHTIFWKGGSKDINDVSQWWYKDGSVPDKDQILHAGAAAYDVDGELIMYTFADRFANDGDALMGVWFFQNEITLNENGTFGGVHKNGDVVVFGEFSGGGVVSMIRIAKWNDPGLTGFDSACTDGNTALPNQISNTKLCVIAEGNDGTGDGYFVTVNTGDETSPWPYTPKQGSADTFPYNSFMEGGFNITHLLGSTPCFSGFLVETRSSTSESATLKDFVLGAINTCKIGVDKTCTSQLGTDGESIDHNFKIYVRNEGFATLTSVDLEDDHHSPNPWTYNTPITTSDGWVLVADYIVNSTTQELSNTVTAVGHAGTAETAPATDTVSCPHVNVTTGLEVVKDCDKTMLEVDNNGTTGTTADDRLWVKVFYTGSVCNKGNVKVTDLTASDNRNGTTVDITTLLSTTTLNPPGVGPAGSDCASFSGSYYPNLPVGSGIVTEDDPLGGCFEPGALQQWTDTVDAEAEAVLGGGTVNATADSANCPLCPTCIPD